MPRFVHRVCSLVWAALVLCLTLPGASLAQSTVVTEHLRAELVVDAPEGLQAGKTVRLGLLLTHQPHWHTYWRNPGDSGLPTTLSWQLPAGVSTGDIEWPTPKRLPLGPLMNYGYEGTVLLPVALSLPTLYAASTLDIRLRADWLVCKDICIPESGEFSLQLPIGPRLNQHAQAFAAARAALPRAVPGATAQARVEGTALVMRVNGLPASLQSAPLQFFPEAAGVFEHAAQIEQRWDAGVWVARIPLAAQRSASPGVIDAVLVPGDSATGVRISGAVVGGWGGDAAAPSTTQVPAAAPAATPAPPPPAATPLALALGLALLGGLLLNLMPCVFPVLSLKVLGFAQPGQSRSTLVAGGLAYTLGVVVSFVLLAGLLLLLRAGGEQLGWGFQLQSPAFVAALALLFTLIGLNLAGVFEVGSVLPSGLATLRSRYPLADHALTGALAVAVASPCTAPFMGVALGTALTMPAPSALAVFAALGLGMALPYLAVACFPAMARALPRPGVWMLRFKVLMAFPMFATVVWLLWVLGQQTGLDGAIALLGLLVAVALAAWALGTPGPGSRARLGLGGLALLVLAVTALWALPSLRTADPQVAGQSANAAEWQPWSPAAIAEANAAGRPVFVDFTAAWCVTCQFNKRTALADAEVLNEFSRKGVVLMRADWTRRDPQITEALAQLNRSGVPVYALYHGGAEAPALLPELLTPSIVKNALSPLPLAATAAR